MGNALITVGDGVHLAPLAPLSMFNALILDTPEGDVVVDSGPSWSGKRLARLEPALIVATHGRPVAGVDRWLDGIHRSAH